MRNAKQWSRKKNDSSSVRGCAQREKNAYHHFRGEDGKIAGRARQKTVHRGDDRGKVDLRRRGMRKTHRWSLIMPTVECGAIVLSTRGRMVHESYILAEQSRYGRMDESLPYSGLPRDEKERSPGRRNKK